MGCVSCSAKNAVEDDQAAKRHSKLLEKQMNDDYSEDAVVSKLLLLGAGESGKSTLFKQMMEIYGTGFPPKVRETYVGTIYNNIITSLTQLVAQSDKYGPIQTEEAKTGAKMLEELKGDVSIDAKLAGHLKAIWNDPGIQATYDSRNMYQLTDSTKFYLDKLDTVSAPDWIPTKQDVLRSRVRTTGIVENKFTIDGNVFRLFDVGGQRNERKKWIHCFENVTAVLFVAALSAYDQTLYEDETTNRVLEALNLFEEICNSRWFRDTAMILFLNKRDLFQEKCTKVSIRCCFPDYRGGDTYEEGVAYFQEQFKARIRSPDKHVYFHVTCATDTDNVAVVFNLAKDIIIKKSLTEAGLL